MSLNVTIRHPKLIQFFNSRPDLSVENVLLESLPLMQLVTASQDDHSNALSKIELLFNDFRISHDQKYSELHSFCKSFEIKQDQSRQFTENALIHFNNDLLNNIRNLFQQKKSDEINFTSNKIELLIKEHQSRTFEFFANKDSAILNSIKSEFNDNKSHIELNSQLIQDKLSYTFKPILEDVQNNIHNFTLISNNSSRKGGLGEHKLIKTLAKAFPVEVIHETNKIPMSGDFIIEHNICGKILIETKDYSENVPSHEVDKFFRDLQKQMCHGIFISQNSGIAHKDNFQVQFFNNKIAVFLHKLNYDHSPILFATTIIKSLMNFALSSPSLVISQISDKQLDSIFNDWKLFRDNKSKIIDSLKLQIKSINDLSLPSLDSFLVSKFNVQNSASFTCLACGQVCKTKAALVSHTKAKHPRNTD